MKLKALIFDVDGTLANTENGHLQAFNFAFKKQGLDWVWSKQLYADLLSVTGSKERMKYYLNTYKKDFSHPDLDGLIASIHQQKNDYFIDLIRQAKMPLRTGVARLMNEAKAAGLKLAIASTTALINVQTLMDYELGKGFIAEFASIGAGDIVANKKPAPDIYHYVLAKLGLNASECLAFEDSNNGIVAATKADLKSIITVTEWTANQNFDGAMVVLNNLGDAQKPFQLIAGEPTNASFVSVDYLQELYAKHY